MSGLAQVGMRRAKYSDVRAAWHGLGIRTIPASMGKLWSTEGLGSTVRGIRTIPAGMGTLWDTISADVSSTYDAFWNPTSYVSLLNPAVNFQQAVELVSHPVATATGLWDRLNAAVAPNPLFTSGSSGSDSSGSNFPGLNPLSSGIPIWIVLAGLGVLLYAVAR